MNRLLIGILDIVNKLLAIFIVLSSTVSGYLGQIPYYDPGDLTPGTQVVGAIAGFIAGLVGAGLVSGLLAAIINLSREATTIRELLVARTPPP
jgi:hypothetical protein